MIKINKYKVEFFLFLLTLISRLPFVSKILYSWDAVQLSLALKHFDLAQHQPHPPGYILYVALGKIFNFIFFNVNTAYVILSIIISALAVIIFYNFLKLLLDDQKSSFFISLILIFNPYFWFYGEVASTYIFDALFSIIFAYLTLLIIKENKLKYFYLFTCFLAVSGGFRQSLLFLFFPLWIYALIILLKNNKISLKQIFINIGLGISFVLIWFLPLIYLSDGWTTYWQVTNWQLSHASQETSIFYGVAWKNIFINLRHIIKITFISLNVCLLVPLLLFCSKIKNNFNKNFNYQIIYL
ncbi:MAG TPA: glycosyltransferase family 39 protein [bacterium]|nr:glycosyltransferase family 39 protein [bacterium]